MKILKEMTTCGSVGTVTAKPIGLAKPVFKKKRKMVDRLTGVSESEDHESIFPDDAKEVTQDDVAPGVQQLSKEIPKAPEQAVATLSDAQLNAIADLVVAKLKSSYQPQAPVAPECTVPGVEATPPASSPEPAPGNAPNQADNMRIAKFLAGKSPAMSNSTPPMLPGIPTIAQSVAESAPIPSGDSLLNQGVGMPDPVQPTGGWKAFNGLLRIGSSTK